MALHLPTFYTRTLSAVVFVGMMFIGLLWNEAAFTILICLIQFLCIREFFLLAAKIFPQYRPVLWVQIAMQAVAAYVVCSNIYFLEQTFNYLSLYKITVLLAELFPAVLFLAAVLSKQSALQQLLVGIGALVYIALPISLLQYLYHQYCYLPMAVFAFLWINDTMAYIIGSFIGKHPLSPVSPKKTWEGTIGGIVLTIVVGLAAHMFIKTYDINFVAVAGCAAIAGTFGDLLESKLKRMAGVKDSGTIMPGHGGALDRFDSLLITVPFVCGCYLLFQ